MYFSTSAVSSGTWLVLPLTPQVDYSSFGIISDKVNWVTLTKNFDTDSAYTQLLIGCFKNDASIDTSVAPYFSSTYANASYYYIDSVAVEKVSIIVDTGVTTHVPGASSALGKIQMFPNPFTDHTTLNFDNPSGRAHTLNLYDLRGKLVRTFGNITTSNLTIDRAVCKAVFTTSNYSMPMALWVAISSLLTKGVLCSALPDQYHIALPRFHATHQAPQGYIVIVGAGRRIYAIVSAVPWPVQSGINYLSPAIINIELLHKVTVSH